MLFASSMCPVIKQHVPSSNSMSRHRQHVVPSSNSMSSHHQDECLQFYTAAALIFALPNKSSATTREYIMPVCQSVNQHHGHTDQYVLFTVALNSRQRRSCNLRFLKESLLASQRCDMMDRLVFTVLVRTSSGSFS